MKANKQLPGTIPDKLQPHNLEAEEAVIGSLLIDSDAIIKVSPILRPGDFFIHRHGLIYDAMLALSGRNEPADLVTLCDELQQRGKLAEVGGPPALTEFMNRTPTSIHATYYAVIVAERATRRRLIDGAGQIARLAFDESGETQSVLDEAESIIFAVTSSQDRESGPVHIRHGLNKHVDRVEYLQAHQNTLSGIPTGLTDLDKCLGGLQPSDMVVIAGRPGMGKTSLALSIAGHAAKSWQKRVAVFSLEMSSQQLIDRLISAETGIDSQRLRSGAIREPEWPLYIEASSRMAELPIFIDDTPALSPFELRTRARRLHAEHGLDLLILDYLQLMNGDKRSENRVQEITFISRQVKALARELNIPILALSQLSRDCEKRNDKRPILSDLRESGAIEQDADVVVFVYRDDVYNPETQFPNVAELIVAKHRSGPTGVFSVYFKKHLAQFVALEVRRTAFEPMEAR